MVFWVLVVSPDGCEKRITLDESWWWCNGGWWEDDDVVDERKSKPDWHERGNHFTRINVNPTCADHSSKVSDHRIRSTCERVAPCADARGSDWVQQEERRESPCDRWMTKHVLVKKRRRTGKEAERRRLDDRYDRSWSVRLRRVEMAESVEMMREVSEEEEEEEQD